MAFHDFFNLWSCQKSNRIERNWKYLITFLSFLSFCKKRQSKFKKKMKKKNLGFPDAWSSEGWERRDVERTDRGDGHVLGVTGDGMKGIWIPSRMGIVHTDSATSFGTERVMFTWDNLRKMIWPNSLSRSYSTQPTLIFIIPGLHVTLIWTICFTSWLCNNLVSNFGIIHNRMHSFSHSFDYLVYLHLKHVQDRSLPVLPPLSNLWPAESLIHDQLGWSSHWASVQNVESLGYPKWEIECIRLWMMPKFETRLLQSSGVKQIVKIRITWILGIIKIRVGWVGYKLDRDFEVTDDLER